MILVEPLLRRSDYIFYLDVDSMLIAPVGDEMFGDLVATVHPGFADQSRQSFTYEHRPESHAYVMPNEGTRYYYGGFQGGTSIAYMSACHKMASSIEADERKGIIAVWYDESHWNRYCIDHPPTVELTHAYSCPEGWAMPEAKIIALSKNHEEIRS